MTKGNTPTLAVPLSLKDLCWSMTLNWDIAQRVPIWGTSTTLTMIGSACAANDLNNMVPSPSSKLEPVRPPSPEIIKGIPGGTESDMNSSAIDSRDDWDKTGGVGVFSCCSHSDGQNRPHLGRGPRCHTGRRGRPKTRPRPGKDIVST